MCRRRYVCLLVCAAFSCSRSSSHAVFARSPETEASEWKLEGVVVRVAGRARIGHWPMRHKTRREATRANLEGWLLFATYKKLGCQRHKHSSSSSSKLETNMLTCVVVVFVCLLAGLCWRQCRWCCWCGVLLFIANCLSFFCHEQ